LQVPIEISFRDIEKNDFLKELIHTEAAQLERLSDNITSCRVSVEQPQKSQQQGQPYRVRVAVRVPPGHELVATEDPGMGDIRKELQTVIRDTFSSVGKQLQKLNEQQRREIKQHPEQQFKAVIAKIFNKDGYGFLRTVDGRQIYFHKNSVLHDDWDRLEIGTGVNFNEEMGTDGPRATSVQIVDKPGVRPKSEEL
jgi:cold shock CspA family protein